MSSKVQPEDERDWKFIFRLSWVLQIVFAALFIAAVADRIDSFGNFSATDIGAVSQRDIEILQALNSVSIVVFPLMAAIPLLGAHFLLRRKNWARIVVIVVFGIVGVLLLMTAVPMLLAGIGVFEMDYGPNATPTFKIAARLLNILIGVVVLGIGYLFWRVIRRFCSANVVKMFRHA